MTTIVFVIMCAIYFSFRTLSAPVIKASGIQWSEPQGAGKGNITLVMIPMNNSENNDSDVIVAVKSDYQIKTYDTQLLNLMVNESVTNKKNFSESKNVQQCSDVEDSYDEQPEINKIKSPNSANYFELPKQLDCSGEEKNFKGHFQPNYVVQLSSSIASKVTPLYPATISKAPVFAEKNQFVQELFNVLNNLQSDTSNNINKMKSNDIKNNGDILLKTDNKHSDKAYLVSGLNNGEVIINKESTQMDDNKYYRSNSEANFDVACYPSTLKKTEPSTITTVSGILPTRVENAETQGQSSRSTGFDSKIPNEVSNELKNNSTVTFVIPIIKDNILIKNGSASQNLIKNSPLTSITGSLVTQLLNTLESAQTLRAVDLEVQTTTTKSNCSSGANIREQTIPNYTQQWPKFIVETSDPLAGKSNDISLIKALCTKNLLESSKATGVFEQISKMVEPHIRLEETTTVLSASGLSDIAQIFTVPTDNQNMRGSPDCVSNEFKQKLRLPKKVTLQPQMMCDKYNSTFLPRENNEDNLKDLDLVQPFVDSPVILDNQIEIPHGKNIFSKSNPSRNKIDSADYQDKSNVIHRGEYELNNIGRWMPIPDNNVISNIPQNNVKSDLTHNIILSQSPSNKNIYVNPNENIVLKMNIAGKNIILEQKRSGYKYNEPSKDVEIYSSFEDKENKTNKSDKFECNTEANAYVNNNQNTLLNEPRITTKESKSSLGDKGFHFNSEAEVLNASCLNSQDFPSKPQENNWYSQFSTLHISPEKPLATTNQDNTGHLQLNSDKYRTDITVNSNLSQYVQNHFNKSLSNFNAFDHSTSVATQSELLPTIVCSQKDTSQRNNSKSETSFPTFISNTYDRVKSQTFLMSTQMPNTVVQTQLETLFRKQTNRQKIGTTEFAYTTTRINNKLNNDQPNNENIVIPADSVKEIVIQIIKNTRNPLTDADCAENRYNKESATEKYDMESTMEKNINNTENLEQNNLNISFFNKESYDDAMDNTNSKLNVNHVDNLREKSPINGGDVLNKKHIKQNTLKTFSVDLGVQDEKRYDKVINNNQELSYETPPSLSSGNISDYRKYLAQNVLKLFTAVSEIK